MNPKEPPVQTANGGEAMANAALNQLIDQCKSVFILEESRRVLAFTDLVLSQIQQMPKIWWFLQLALVVLGWRWIAWETDVLTLRRGLAILAALFVILVVPGLFANRRVNAIEIELTTLYNLRAIYAIRLVIYGAVDTVLITAFTLAAVLDQGMGMGDVIAQFILPVVITASICLVVLSRPSLRESVAIIWSMVGAGLWAVMVSNQTVYGWLISPLVIGIFLLVLFIGGVAVNRILSPNASVHLERIYCVNA